MFHTPEYIVFRVEIDGKEYLGRPNTMKAKQAGTNQEGIFYAYSSVQSFMAGCHEFSIEVTSVSIKGIEAIDTVNPEPLNNILAACNDIESINPKADIGVIRPNTAPKITALASALEAFEKLHDLPRFEVIYENLQDLMAACAKCRFDLSENNRVDFIRDLKEKASFNVTRLVEFSAQVALS